MYKVLIVEDDPMVAMINEQYVMKNKNFSVCGKCKDGLSALEFLETNSVDLIIMDVYMPKLDGFETLRQIRKKQISADVIMVTAANDRDSLEEALHLGIVYYLVKPFSITTAIERIREIAKNKKEEVKTSALNRNRPVTTDEKISEIFISIGIPPHIKGYG